MKEKILNSPFGLGGIVILFYTLIILVFVLLNINVDFSTAIASLVGVTSFTGYYYSAIFHNIIPRKLRIYSALFCFCVFIVLGFLSGSTREVFSIGIPFIFAIFLFIIGAAIPGLLVYIFLYIGGKLGIKGETQVKTGKKKSKKSETKKSSTL